jgi:tyrosyl-tRNA synthetase
VSDIHADLKWRGLIQQATDEAFLPDWLKQPRAVYAGFDPTADSLHVGHLMGLVVLRRFQRAGHRPIALLGGATGMIGDPSGKSEERNLLSEDALRGNVEKIEVQVRRLLDFDSGSNAAVLVNNYDWMKEFGYLRFLREIGKNFPVNVMLGKESVKARLERTDAGLSYTEFSYMLLQSYDFVHLQQRHGCELQVGGSDQWGNITAGIDLARRMLSVQLYGMTWPLLTKGDGTKMGKTESGAVWLSAERTSPYQFYQYWINVDDNDAGVCLRFLTDLDHEEIQSLDASREQQPARRDSQRRLAEALTSMIHGDEALSAAQRATSIFFGAEITQATDQELGDIFADVPSQSVERQRLVSGELNIVDALVEAQLAKSKSEARRTVQEGGAYVNNRRIAELDQVLGQEHLASPSVMVLRRGKKRYALLRFSGADAAGS